MTPGDYHIILMQIVFRVCVCGPWTVVRKLKEKKTNDESRPSLGLSPEILLWTDKHNYYNFELGGIFARVHWILSKDVRKYFRMTIFPIFFLYFFLKLFGIFGLHFWISWIVQIWKKVVRHQLHFSTKILLCFKSCGCIKQTNYC